MGYYATMLDWDTHTAKIKDVAEFEKRRAAECEYGFSPENLQITFGPDGSVKKFELQEVDVKWYDEQEFSALLREFLIDGYMRFWFIGEDLEQWDWTVFPGIVLDGNWEELNANFLYDIFSTSKASESQKAKVIEKYCQYWNNILAKAKTNLKICRKGGNV